MSHCVCVFLGAGIVSYVSDCEYCLPFHSTHRIDVADLGFGIGLAFEFFFSCSGTRLLVTECTGSDDETSNI